MSFMIIGCDTKQAPAQQKQSMPVQAQNITASNVTLSFEYAARLKSVQSINVYARVEGILTAQYFKEGDIVKKGDKLFKIDPTRYATRVNIAKASHQSAKANLDKALKDWQRVEKLYKQGVYTIDQYDTSLYNYQSAQAQEQNTKANLDDALIDLGYTDVVADITGRTGLRSYDVGNLVGQSGGSNILTTITQLTPIYAEFSIPSNDFYYMKGLNKDNIQVEFILDNGTKTYETLGKIDFIDSVIDSQTSSIKARAIVENNDYRLIPNEFIRVRLFGFEAKNAVAIPQTALMQDTQGSYVYIIKDNKAQIARVVLGQSLKDNQILIMSGLKQGDVLITTNLTKLRAGADVISVSKNQDKPAKN